EMGDDLEVVEVGDVEDDHARVPEAEIRPVPGHQGVVHRPLFGFRPGPLLAFGHPGPPPATTFNGVLGVLEVDHDPDSLREPLWSRRQVGEPAALPDDAMDALAGGVPEASLPG